MIATVLFDFGGVIVRTPFEVLDTAWRGPFDPSTDPQWRALQAGDITERDYWRAHATALFPEADEPLPALLRASFEADESAVVRPEILPLLDDLGRRGVGIGLLTNDMSAFNAGDWIGRLDVVARFDPVIDLSHAPALKPAGAAFAHAVAVLNADPGRVMVVDDQPANVEGARASGLAAVWFDPTDVAGSVDRVLAVAA